jgi:hypothetical protein
MHGVHDSKFSFFFCCLVFKAPNRAFLLLLRLQLIVASRPLLWRVIYRYTLYRRHEMIMRRRQKYPRVKCYGGLYRARRQPLQDALLEEIKEAVKDMPLAKYGSSDEVTLVGSEEKKKWSDVLSWD